MSVDTAYLEKKYRADTIYYFFHLYNNPDSTIGHFFYKKDSKNDSILFEFSFPAKLVDVKKYVVLNKEYTVSAYWYDEEDKHDEESMIYYCKDYGTLIVVDYGWYTIPGIFMYDDISFELCKNILSDSSFDFIESRTETILGVLEKNTNF